MLSPEAAERLDHVVVLMFENRSFDNVLGYLYTPTSAAPFEGVIGRSLTNPIPVALAGGPSATAAVHPARNLHTPDPDPGEEYPHVNTQLFGTVLPPENRFKAIDDLQAPYNAPPDGTGPPNMSGFVIDYANTFQVEMGRPPTVDECGAIMGCYTPEQLPVLSTLARHFACFDRWFCEVPSQTYPNRSFFHAASSSGFVLNGPPGKFATGNDAPTVFEQLTAAGLSWRVYVDPEQILPATALIHARRLAPYFATHFGTTFDFYEDARTGDLPEYSFIEPNMFHPHTDMHPPSVARLRHELHLPAPDSMIGGERLLADVYNAVRTATTAGRSNWSNTLLLVTFDEHGGTFDHIPPPPAAPPTAHGPPGELGFRFDRSGVRIPTLAISAWVEPGSVIHEEFRSTSMIRTLRARWGLPRALTQRDDAAADLSPVLSRSSPIPPTDWPTIPTPTLPLLVKVVAAIDHPMAELERDLLGDALAHEANITGDLPSLDPRALTHGEAHRHMIRIGMGLFPGVARGAKRAS